MKRLCVAAWLWATLCAGSASGAEAKFNLRLSTIVPDGTTWAREMKAMAREVEDGTRGDVHIKIYFGGIAGDDVQSADRVDRGQLDGVLSGGMLCERRAPTHRALRLVGLYRSGEEASFVAGQLRPQIEEESRKNGFVYLGDVNAGPTDIFMRRPLRTLDELKREKLWVWDADEVQRAILAEMGFNLAPLPLEQAGKAFAEGRHDGFIAIPGAMLAYQWSAKAKYVTDLHISFLIACFLVGNRAFDRLPLEHQQVMRLAAARMRARLDDVIEQQDRSLLGGLFQHQGLVKVAVGAELLTRFREAAEHARATLGEKIIPAALYKRVIELVGEYRSKHHSEGDQ